MAIFLGIVAEPSEVTNTLHSRSDDQELIQNFPFVVEVKQKREPVKRPEPLWAGIDLAALAKDVAEGENGLWRR
ncbi:hypothetical protein [Mesorhizobium sp.]|uniref:hypothetical protein n=1 Tax=Mesorhizobium sp. TaxID=1871066 RepID=UPI0025F7DE9E|nr:hypothetical protein [Mesorhizobium sp.]